MIKNVIYKKNGSIEMNNTELLRGRTDMSYEPGEEKLHSEELGGLKGEEEQQLKVDLKRTGWKESRKATDVKHACPVCGTRYWGRPNKNYCGIPCKEIAKKRRQRKRKRDIRDFKPHAGTAGEVYYMIPVKGRDVISFIPANFADTRIKAKGYIEERYSTEDAETILEQIKEVLRK